MNYQFINGGEYGVYLCFECKCLCVKNDRNGKRKWCGGSIGEWKQWKISGRDAAHSSHEKNEHGDSVLAFQGYGKGVRAKKFFWKKNPNSGGVEEKEILFPSTVFEEKKLDQRIMNRKKSAEQKNWK